MMSQQQQQQQPIIRIQYPTTASSGISMREMKSGSSTNNKNGSNNSDDERRDDSNNDESLNLKQQQQQQQQQQEQVNNKIDGDKAPHHHHHDNEEEDDDDDTDPNNNSYENESLGLVYSINSSSNGSNYNKMNRSNSPPRRSFYYSHHRQFNQQHQHQHNQQRWKRLPITEDDYLDDIDELNSTDEWNSSNGGGGTGSTSFYYNSTMPSKRIRRIGICVFVIAILAVLIPRSAKKHITGSDLLDAPQAAKKIKGTPQYSCPMIKTTNDDNDNDENKSRNTTLDSIIIGDNNETNAASSTTTNTNDISNSIPTTPESTDYDTTIVQIMEEFALNVSSNLEYYVTNYANLTINQLHLLPYLTTTTTIGGQQQQQQSNTDRTGPNNQYAYTYEQMKDSIRDWKTSKFLANLKTGDSIYHSGSGIGWNLLITLEILQEENDAHYISDLHVYGNDHIPVVAQLANIVLDAIFDAATSNPSKNNYFAKRGVICSADSTLLHTFIPEDSFDLVYASSIPALPDPLQLMNTMDDTNNVTITTVFSSYNTLYNELCSNDKNTKDWKVQKLLQLAQQHQNDWYATWVTEMIYIAKAGAPIIIEYIGQPYCSTAGENNNNNNNNIGSSSSSTNNNKDTIIPNNNGSIIGVSKSFWEHAITQYKWNIDPKSLIIEDDKLFPSTYHVFMRINDA